MSAPEGSQGQGSAYLFEMAESFLEDLNSRISRILKVQHDPMLIGEHKKDHFFIGTSPTGILNRGIQVTHRGETVIYLEIKMRCILDRAGRYVAVDYSTFKVKKSKGKSPQPLVTFDYARVPRAPDVPVSHVNIHADNRFLEAMMQHTAGGPFRTKLRAKAMKKGKTVAVSDLHFPIGGHRFRPCLEDVLEFLIVEFNVDRQSGWQAAVHEGRQNWKRIQTRSVVRDDPQSAAIQLMELGYVLDAPSMRPEPHAGRITRY